MPAEGGPLLAEGAPDERVLRRADRVGGRGRETADLLPGARTAGGERGERETQQQGDAMVFRHDSIPTAEKNDAIS